MIIRPSFEAVGLPGLSSKEGSDVFHRNAKLGLAGRLALVSAIEAGCSFREAAAAFQCLAGDGASLVASLAVASEEERRSLSVCLIARAGRVALRGSSRRSSSRRSALAGARRAGGLAWSPARPVRALDRLEGAAAGWDLAAAPSWRSEPANRYEWPCPGDLLHMDTSRYARFLRPGHRVTGDRSQRSRNWMQPETRVGYDYAHAIVDDHSRLAYVELHDDEKAATVTGFVERALAYFADHGIIAKRLMTDNAFSYVKNRSLRELLAHEQSAT